MEQLADYQNFDNSRYWTALKAWRMGLLTLQKAIEFYQIDSTMFFFFLENEHLVGSKQRQRKSALESNNYALSA